MPDDEAEASRADWTCWDEARLRAEVPVFINSFEQPTYVRDSVAWFHRHGFGNITIFDQGSVSDELRGYFGSAEFARCARLWDFRKNIGPRRAVRRCVALNGIEQPMIFTDPDLELPEPPCAEFMIKMVTLARRYDVVKIGPALDIFDAERIDLDMDIGNGFTVARYYRRFFQNEVEPDTYLNGIDTTFFLYVPRAQPRSEDILSSQPRIPAIRLAGKGFLAGHRPWMFDTGMGEAETAFYRSRTSTVSTLFGRSE